MKKALVVLFLLTVGLGVSGAIDAAGGSRFSGPLPKFSAVTHDDYRNRENGGWAPVPNTWVQFTTTRRGPAVATFCAGTAIEAVQTVLLRVVGAGKGQWKPGEVTFNADRNWFRTRCFSWFATLPAGTHTVRAQWASTGRAHVHHRSLKVEHQD